MGFDQGPTVSPRLPLILSQLSFVRSTPVIGIFRHLVDHTTSLQFSSKLGSASQAHISYPLALIIFVTDAAG